MLQKVLMKIKQVPENTYVWLGIFILGTIWISFVTKMILEMFKLVVENG